jgi:hypothetical protein
MKVRVEIDPLATDNESYDNCAARARRNGGAVVVGWRLRAAPEHGGHVVSREHHAVWRGPSGELLDITPRLVLTERGLQRLGTGEEIEFEADPEATFLQGRPRPNTHVPSGDDPHGLLKKACEWANKAAELRAAGDAARAEYADKKVADLLAQHQRRVARP